jgi:hypothetical protein
MKFRAALPALAAAALVLLPAVAHADTLTKTDAAGDVLTEGGSASTAGTLDPTRTNGDITRSVITHGPSNLKVKLVHRDLAKVGRIITVISVKTDKAKNFRRFEIVAAPGRYYGTVVVHNKADKKVSCKTTRKIDYAANTTLLTIPRRCLGNPRWVRVGAGVITTDNGFGSIYGDDARTNGTVGGEDPVFSNKVFR